MYIYLVIFFVPWVFGENPHGARWPEQHAAELCESTKMRAQLGGNQWKCFATGRVFAVSEFPRTVKVNTGSCQHRFGTPSPPSSLPLSPTAASEKKRTEAQGKTSETNCFLFLTSTFSAADFFLSCFDGVDFFFFPPTGFHARSTCCLSVCL